MMYPGCSKLSGAMSVDAASRAGSNGILNDQQMELNWIADGFVDQLQAVDKNDEWK